MDKANIGKNSSPLRRPTAVRLAETLAGKDTLQRENFTSSLEAALPGILHSIFNFLAFSFIVFCRYFHALPPRLEFSSRDDRV